MTSSEILYATIKTWELRERYLRDDVCFDAFEYLSKKIGHKHPSTLRNMCNPRKSGSNAAKLGFDEAAIIVKLTGDKRLFAFFRDQIGGL
jgi:hypothetical protein